jgi:hypothetical protein
MMKYGKKPPMMLLLKKMSSDMQAPDRPMKMDMESDYEYDSEGFDYHNEGKHAAAQEMMEAMRDNNSDSFAMALENFIKMCMK